MVGQTISHYRIVERLGAGGMGVVYRAEDLRLERPVALKFLPEEFTRDPASMERLLREAKAASALHHQNIRSTFAFDEAEGRQFIVMELLEGQPLDRVIANRPLPLDTLLAYAIQTADALQVAHARGIVHRDIKPANLFVTDAGVVKVLDFGLAKRHISAPAETGADDATAALPQLTLSGTTVGTASYMAPEQVLGAAVDQRSDLFSFGAVLFEMATGHRAFSGPTFGAIIDFILNRPPASPRSLTPDLPPSVEHIILKALEKDPSLRYQTAAEIRTDLQRAIRELGSGSGYRIDVPARTSGGSHPAGWRPGHDAETMALTPVPVPAGGGSGTSGAAGTASQTASPSTSGSAVRAAVRRRRGLMAAGIGLMTLILAMGGLWLAMPRATYYPCVVIGEFQSSVETAPAALIEFQLKRALSQVPDLTIYEQRGFELAQKAAARPSGSVPWWRRWIPGSGRTDPVGPAVRLSAQIDPSLGNIAVELSVNARGRLETVTLPYKGITELLDKGVDDVVRQAVERFHDGDADRAAASLQSYRSSRGLLSPHLDATRSYWRARDAWGKLDLGAERDVKRALEIDPEFALARLLSAEIQVFQGRRESAEAEIQRARSKPDALTEAERLRSAALLARVSGNAPEERVQLQKLIELEPTNKEYVFELGESYFHTADIDEARQQYEHALQLDPNYALAHNHLGYCYSWSGEHERALKEFNRYLELDQSANAWDSLGDAHLHAGEYARAAEAKEKALSLDPQLYFTRNSLAVYDILQGRYSAARRRLDAAITDTPDPFAQATFQVTRAFLELRAGQFDRAAEACAAGLALVGPASNDSPTDELLWLQGQIALARPKAARDAAAAPLARLGRIVTGGRMSATNFRSAYKYWLHLSALADVAAGKPADAAARLDDLAHVRLKLGYWGTAYDQAFFLNAIGLVRESIGDAGNAERAYRDALAYNPRFPVARFSLAMLLRKTGRSDEAAREFDAFVAGWPDADPSAPEMQHVAARRLSTPAPAKR